MLSRVYTDLYQAKPPHPKMLRARCAQSNILLFGVHGVSMSSGRDRNMPKIVASHQIPVTQQLEPQHNCSSMTAATSRMLAAKQGSRGITRPAAGVFLHLVDRTRLRENIRIDDQLFGMARGNRNEWLNDRQRPFRRNKPPLCSKYNLLP